MTSNDYWEDIIRLDIENFGVKIEFINRIEDNVT